MNYIHTFDHNASKRFTVAAQGCAMKNRLTFLLIASRTGVQRQFSIDKKIFYFFICFLMLLIGGGTAGLWKANENLELAQKKHRLGN